MEGIFRQNFANVMMWNAKMGTETGQGDSFMRVSEKGFIF
jgi:hypothetical protein